MSAESRWGCSRCVGSMEQVVKDVIAVNQGDDGTAWSPGGDAPGG